MTSGHRNSKLHQELYPKHLLLYWQILDNVYINTDISVIGKYELMILIYPLGSWNSLLQVKVMDLV